MNKTNATTTKKTLSPPKAILSPPKITSNIPRKTKNTPTKTKSNKPQISPITKIVKVPKKPSAIETIPPPPPSPVSNPPPPPSEESPIIENKSLGIDNINVIMDSLETISLHDILSSNENPDMTNMINNLLAIS
jgi:hypothetical protein